MGDHGTLGTIGDKVLRDGAAASGTRAWSSDYVYRYGLLLATIDGFRTTYALRSGVVTRDYYPFGGYAKDVSQTGQTERKLAQVPPSERLLR